VFQYLEGPDDGRSHPERVKESSKWQIKKPATMTDEQWEELDEKVLSTIQLCWATHALCKVLDKTTTLELWLWLEALYMTKSLANKIHLKERRYTCFMAKGTLIQNHLDEFNSIIFDLESLYMKIEEDDKAILLVGSLTP